MKQLEAEPPHRLALRQEDAAAVFKVEYRVEPTQTGTRFTQVSDFTWKRLPRCASTAARSRAASVASTTSAQAAAMSRRERLVIGSAPDAGAVDLFTYSVRDRILWDPVEGRRKRRSSSSFRRRRRPRPKGCNTFGYAGVDRHLRDPNQPVVPVLVELHPHVDRGAGLHDRRRGRPDGVLERAQG